MTANHEHTPTSTQIREDYAHLRYHFADGWSIGEERVQFDNWLTAEIAAAEQRGAERALRNAAQVLREDVDIVFNKHRGIFFREDEADRKGISPWGWLENRADRIADQMEGDDEKH